MAALSTAAFMASGLLASAQADTSQISSKLCYFSVDGKVLVNGRCFVMPADNGGYMLNLWAHGKPRHSHFAAVEATGHETGSATWNADPNDSHAYDPLGPVRFTKGCWVNGRTRICAR